MGRPGETWEGRERLREAGRDVGRSGVQARFGRFPNT